MVSGLTGNEVPLYRGCGFESHALRLDNPLLCNGFSFMSATDGTSRRTVRFAPCADQTSHTQRRK